MPEEKREKLVQQIVSQEEKTQKLKAKLKEFDKKEKQKKREEETKRLWKLGISVDGVLRQCLGKNYPEIYDMEKVIEYLKSHLGEKEENHCQIETQE